MKKNTGLVEYYTNMMGYEASISHRLLGSDEYVDELYNKAVQIFSKINHSYNCQNLSKIKAYTIPHAGFRFSGLLAMLIILEILEQHNPKIITILWFIHNPNSNFEHSYKNIEELFQKFNQDIILKRYLIDNNTELSSINIEGPLLISTDFSHHNYLPSSLNLYNVWNNDKHNINLHQNRLEPCGKEPLRILKEWCLKKKYVRHFYIFRFI